MGSFFFNCPDNARTKIKTDVLVGNHLFVYSISVDYTVTTNLVIPSELRRLFNHKTLKSLEGHIPSHGQISPRQKSATCL